MTKKSLKRPDMREALILLALALPFIALLGLSGSAAPQPADWWNASWHYRIQIEINNTGYDRVNWPVEQDINFTQHLAALGRNGTFNTDSIRVIEQNSTGGVVSEIESQIDYGGDFAASSNAYGTLVFLMKGRTQAGASRYFYVYFDITENGAKPSRTYQSQLNYSWDGKVAEVNNTRFTWKIDTVRGENTSGLYEVREWNALGDGTIIFATMTDTEPSKEYLQYSNGTHNFSFDFRNNATFRQGPLRIVLEQNGNETLWNRPNDRTEGFMVKKYKFYENSSWIRIEQNFTNRGASSLMRNSTSAGALSVTRLNEMGAPLFVSGNTANPGSWIGAQVSGSYGFGIINENQTGTTNYFADGGTGIDRAGITLSDTTVPAGASITDSVVMHFNATTYNWPMLQAVRDQVMYPPLVTVSGAEPIPFAFSAGTNHNLYNRNETVLISGNVTLDIANVTYAMNATSDMGTPEVSDDLRIILYDDGNALHGDSISGDKIFSNYLNISDSSATGAWNITVRSYDSSGIFLNASYALFNVTDIYNVTLAIENPAAPNFTSRQINATLTVMNLRSDTFIGGATVNCSYNSTPVTNITDFGNGTYVINFTAPSSPGDYVLNCSAERFNNTGSDSRQFRTETSRTSMEINLTPANYTALNISVSASDSFAFKANATDIGGADARSVNITVSLPQNFSANITQDQCGIVPINLSCARMFNITVANRTLPGNYTLNVSAIWQNPDFTTNSTNTSFTVYVLANPLMDVFESNVSGAVADGTSAIAGNFTVRSFGNVNSTDITFNTSGLQNFTIVFSPENISWIAPDANRSVSVNVSVPQDTPPGNYSGIVNVTSAGAGWDIIDLNISVPATTLMSIGISPENRTSSNISVFVGDTFNLTITATDTGAANARYVNITMWLPENVSSNSTFEECGNVTLASSCLKFFNITVANRTLPGNYTLNVSAVWQNPDFTVNYTNSSFTIYVLPNPRMDILEQNITATISDGTSAIAGNFTVRSFGNVNSTDITFNTSGLQNFTIVFSPENISWIAPDANRSVSVNVSVPVFTPPGNYSGIVNVTSANGGWDVIGLNITVPERLNWSAEPTSCEAIESYINGTVCSVVVSNTGNNIINFTVFPSWLNWTYPNETDFGVAKNSTHNFTILYNVSNNSNKGDYTSAFNISALQAVAWPRNITLSISIIASSAPKLSISVTPDEAEQAKSIGILVSATDRSGTGVNRTEINVTLPNSTVEQFTMTLLNKTANISYWYFNFSGNMLGYNATGNTSYNYTGSALQKGSYGISVASADNLNATGEISSSFKIYTKLVPTISVLAPKYYQGWEGSIKYNLTDAAGAALQGANVTFELFDPSEFILRLPDSGTYITTADGKVFPRPRFSLSNVDPPGTYNLTANTTYFDSVLNRTINASTTLSFLVQAGGGGGGGGLDAFVDTQVVWYPDNVIRFVMWFAFNGNASDPENLTFVVRDPAGSNIINVIDINDTNLKRMSSGLYNYSYAMGANTARGPYLAILTASKEGYTANWEDSFRVAGGGPYDLRINLLQSEVERPGDLSFEITMVNNGEAGQDVNLQYWVTFGNETWDNKNEVYFTPAHSNSTITRSVHVYSDQQLGITTLNVKMYYDIWQPAVLANATFSVVESAFEIPPPPPKPPWVQTGGGGGTGGVSSVSGTVTAPVIKSKAAEEAGPQDISIVNYPRQVNILRGWTEIQAVEVKNTGSTVASNVSLDVTGIPRSWVEVTPSTPQVVMQGNSTIFLLEFKVPKNAEAGEYTFTMAAKSKAASDEKVGKLSVFLSLEELLKNDIRSIKLELQKLEDDTDFAEGIGKNVEKVRRIIDEAKAELKSAEDNLNKGDHDSALANTQTASGLIKRGRQLLESAEAPSATARELPKPTMWLAGLIAVILALILVGIIVIMLKSRDKFALHMPHLQKKKEEEKESTESTAGKEELAAEKEKMERMSKLLADELKDGTITQDVYNELKKRNDEKLAKLNKGISA